MLVSSVERTGLSFYGGKNLIKEGRNTLTPKTSLPFVFISWI